MTRSEQLFAEAQARIPGGVNSPVRAFKSVGTSPRFITKGKGSRIWDADGKEYIDCVLSWGPLILGHAHPVITEAIIKAAELGTSFGAATESEVRFAELICSMIPSIEKVRLVSSGTEATMSALRLARGFTGREKLIKFEGCYHGHADSFLVKSGSGTLTFGQPSSPGVTKGTAADTLTAPYNDLTAVEKLFTENEKAIACVIVEPVAGNMGLVLPEDGFLKGLRRLCDQHGALLIFDEVITGFRLGLGGAQGKFGVTPDLTTLGKIIGGGLPVGAFGGKAEIMDHLSPIGPVYQAGTLSGNPLAVAAGMAMLNLLKKENPYPALESKMNMLCIGLEAAAKKAGVISTVLKIGSLGCGYFAKGPMKNLTDVMRSDTKKYGAFHAAMLEQGVYLAPSQFEVFFISTAHTDEDISQIVAASEKAF